MSKIITQKYTSVDQIDSEFISPLEQLLAENVPSFEYIQKCEQMAPENTHFNYFLFFGPQTNAPIGFAQVKIVKDAEKKQNIFKKIIARKSIKREINENSAHWTIPGANGEGIVFNPKYSNYVGEKTAQVFSEILSREDIYKEKITFSEVYQRNLIDNKNIKSAKHQEKVVIDCLVKNKSSYQEYLSTLSDSTQKEIIRTWKFVQRELNFKMGEYEQLKDVFAYKERGGEQLKKLKANPLFDLYNLKDAKITYLTFETNYEVKSMALFIKGNGIHAFYDVIQFDETLPEMMPHQQVLMHFFEQDKADRLHYLGENLASDYLLKLGFTYKKQLVLSASKDEK